MIIHVTRHGQPNLEGISKEIDPEIPTCDPELTELGRKQAAFLGERLKKDGFKGVIFSSPYRRTLDTAQVVAEITGAKIMPEKAIQEYVLADGFPDFEGLDIQRIKDKYSCIDKSSALDYPWFVRGIETIKEVKERVKPFLDRLLKSEAEEVLLVGHGASVHACKELLISKQLMAQIKEGFNWNCSLSSYNFAKDGNVTVERLFDVGHIPEEHITSNKKLFKEEPLHE